MFILQKRLYEFQRIVCRMVIDDNDAEIIKALAQNASDAAYGFGAVVVVQNADADGVHADEFMIASSFRADCSQL